MKIKVDDTVMIIAGKDRGKTGKVLKTFPKKDQVIVENINMVTKHNKPQGPANPGGIEKKEAPIHVSNVMYFDAKTGKGTRIGYRIENGKKVRFAKSSNETIK
ncbi:MAG: 50S ribosomal protein L24 [Tissierellia bacterium]|nr:50S ribosomal protein L24 [Tissierellia bacterium]